MDGVADRDASAVTVPERDTVPDVVLLVEPEPLRDIDTVADTLALPLIEADDVGDSVHVLVTVVDTDSVLVTDAVKDADGVVHTTLPAAEYWPAPQLPLQAAAVKPGLLPYRPALQLVHIPAPPSEYWPAGQMDAVGVVDPAGQAYPALQMPVHDDWFMAALAPYCPALQFVHAAAPAMEYWPAGHAATAGVVDAAGQTYPAVQAPLQSDVVKPVVLPYRPGAAYYRNARVSAATRTAPVQVPSKKQGARTCRTHVR